MKNTKVLQKSNVAFLALTLMGFFGLVACSKKAVPIVSQPSEYIDGFPAEPTKPSIDTMPSLQAIESISEIYLPLVIDTAALLKQVNLLIPKVLYEDNDITDDKMIIRAEKIDSVNLVIQPNTLIYNVPFKLYIERDISISRLKAEGSLRLYFRTDYSIKPDWSFESKTTISKHEWIDKPKIKVGFLNIPIEPIADRIMSRSADLVCQNIDAQLQEGFKLRDYVDLAWRKIQQPILITDKPIVSWLLIQPEKIKMVPFSTQNGQVQTSIVFRSKTDMAFGAKPELPYAGILPTFEQLQERGKDSLIEIAISFPLKRAEILLNDYFRGQEFREGNKLMIVDSLQLSGNGKKLRVRAFISGSYPATLEFEGIPVYNRLERQFELSELDYTLRSKNLLVKAASWILKKNLNKTLLGVLIYEVGVYMDSGRINLANALGLINAKGFRMRSDIEDTWAEDPILVGDQAQIKFLAKGKFKFIIDELVK